MKTKHLVLTFVGLVASWTIDTQFNTSYSNESGAPSAVTGSPGDGNKTCAKSGCHTGFAVVNVPNLITSNIPPSGYVPGTTYTITSTCSQPGISRWGFEISPQDNSGNMLGQIIITDPGKTKIKGTKYVTQTATGSGGNGSITWSFDWMAPAAGTGIVTFYGSFNYANNNGSDGGDHIKTSTLVVTENTGTTGMTHTADVNNSILIWPNPVIDLMSVKFHVSEQSTVKIILMSLDRKAVKALVEEKMSSGIFYRQFAVDPNLPGGTYLICVTAGSQTMYKKITVLPR